MIDFIKMHGTGNNYIYIDCIKNNYNEYNFSLLSEEISNQNYGIGSDGLILICKSEKADAKMIMYNKDGSEGSMCGNGIRCVAKYVYENYKKNETLFIETKSGIKKIKIILNNEHVISIIVDMGIPIFSSEDIPTTFKDKIIINKKIKIKNNELHINCVSVGNPHVVIFVKNIDNYDIEHFGNLIQKSSFFPNSCNVSFVQIINKTKIKIRVFERGSGETFSCGTGACASVVIATINKYINENEEIEVELKGGKLYIIYNNNIYMKGPAEIICYGKYIVKNKSIIKN